jgi:hypothetical protein
MQLGIALFLGSETLYLRLPSALGKVHLPWLPCQLSHYNLFVLNNLDEETATKKARAQQGNFIRA